MEDALLTDVQGVKGQKLQAAECLFQVIWNFVFVENNGVLCQAAAGQYGACTRLQVSSGENATETTSITMDLRPWQKALGS